MNRLLFVFLLAADPKSAVDAFAAHKGVSPLSTSLATSTSSSLSSRRSRAEVSTAKRNRQHQPDSSNIIQDARGFKRLKRRKILKASTMGALGLLAVASRSSVANAAKKAAAVAVVPVLELPSTKTLALACLVPTLLGYYKSGNYSDWLAILIIVASNLILLELSEYGVSYGYGQWSTTSQV